MTQQPGTRYVVVGGGAVGRLLVDLLLVAPAQVSVVDRGPRPPWLPEACCFHRGDITAIGTDLLGVLRCADVVLLAVPEQAALAAVRDVAAALPAGALLVDTLSVKTRIVPALRATGSRLELLSINPMFAPSLGLAGRPVAVVGVREGLRSRELLARVEHQGGRLARLTEQEHDRVTAAVQALTHVAVLAFGLALAELDVDMAAVAAVATPPHLLLLGLLARISCGPPHAYRDIQVGPNAAAARDALGAAAARLDRVVQAGDPAEFEDVLGGLRRLLGADLEHYGDLCRHSIAALDTTTPRPPSERSLP